VTSEDINSVKSNTLSSGDPAAWPVVVRGHPYRQLLDYSSCTKSDLDRWPESTGQRILDVCVKLSILMQLAISQLLAALHKAMTPSNPNNHHVVP
jgi:hypothetical protein